MPLKAVPVTLLCSILLSADEPALKRREPLPPECASGYCVRQGQHIAIKFLNTLSTRNAQGDRLYLRTVFPVTASGHVLIPVGSYIDAELLGMNRAGRTRGRAEFYIRMGTLTLPNGVQRQLHASLEKLPEPDRKPVPPSCPLGMLAAVFTMHGPDIVIAPGTTAEIVLQDPIVFRPEEVQNR